MEWLQNNPLPIGEGASAFVDWLTANFTFIFDAISNGLGAFIDAVLFLLQWPHPFVVVAAFGAIAYAARRSIPIVIFTVAGLLLIINLGFWDDTTQTLALVLASTAVCMLIGVPLGVAAARRDWLYAGLRPVLDLMQTIPTFVYLIPALILFGLGVVPGLVATVIFALPSSIRLTRLGIASTPRQLLEAGDAFGATRLQRLFKIEIPYALPQIMAGLTQTIMLSLSMVVIAALVGAPGLGVPVLRALNSINIGQGFEAGLAIVLLAIILDRFFRIDEKTRS
ncbi:MULTISPECIES: choline ABC transporter permease subunit [unclassified Aurantimonas]|uniref:choline ABC transporter permease subunit n=1 Tax=unclassified Aurantimonas TaxID=2638230 RepID=UPI002E197670|nr:MULTISPECIES: choline ABC transporter permease subunit [unclassified Aurantimonas]MEC5291997.1 choline ABC transporter permease subunit [Aurantimonas sp. C2-3-R2]MEC5325372.1 choline ABC transporter permease subunit [Aurantimonas sp. A3-2-R12]MEC5413083.1 choline ABC transporter permease subunit [Aurantimonas sp. C2-4-R8]